MPCGFKQYVPSLLSFLCTKEKTVKKQGCTPADPLLKLNILNSLVHVPSLLCIVIV